ncbi:MULTISPECIES: PP2C family serine/threonine-protein phosphatase [Thermocrispum]|uniref:Serine/threonine-protein phosphatase n=1 Tax=Thermocrispum agreste TaxID=37925 RepID=A0ABD6FDU3_9PSEU|nr:MULTISPECIES: PP2C family serine/threonine-protein phosphatase [Thermocrispum]
MTTHPPSTSISLADTEPVRPSQVCPGCSSPVGWHDRFCEVCGRNLLVHRTPVGGPDPSAAAQACVSCDFDRIDAEGFCLRCGRAQPRGRDRVIYDLDGVVAGVSDRGRRRTRNEDALALGFLGRRDDPSCVVAVVCDGVAFSSRATEASQAAADTAVDILLSAMSGAAEPVAATRAAAAAASAAVNRLADDPGELTDGPPATTYVSAVVTENEVTVGWLGDSRAYWLATGPRSTRSRCLTVDHTRANELVASGVNAVDAGSAEDATALARWLGADAEDPQPQIQRFRPHGPGTVLLCTDGLWGYLSGPPVLAAHLPIGGRDPLGAAMGLTDAANERGGRDNITVAAIPFPLRGADEATTARSDGS